MDALDVLEMGAAVSLSAASAKLDLLESGCSGDECPCRLVVTLLREFHSSMEEVLQLRACYNVYYRILANMAETLIRGQHSPDAQLACAEAHYRWEQ